MNVRRKETEVKLSAALAVVILALIAVLYGVYGNAQEVAGQGRSAIGWMIGRWNSSAENLSHGWLIPLVSLYALWRMRDAIAGARKRVCLPGLAVIVLSLLLHWVGVRAQLTRLSLLSLIGLLWGIPFYFYGRQVAGLLVFPCSYLVFCVPMSFLNNVTVPLRLIASAISAGVLNGLGVSVIRRGTMIRSLESGGFNLDVADPCSGLRSLLAMTALTAAYAWVSQKGLVRKWALFMAAVPIAMAGNIVRIITIALVAKWFGQERAMAVYHTFSGFLVFVVAILLMTGFGQLLRRTECET